jgi:excisionase family DNA binding protein
MKLSDLTAPDAPATITVEQVAEVMGLSRSAAYDGVKRGEIPSLRVGRRIFVPVAKLLEILGATNQKDRKRQITVVLPDEPPVLTPKAARALLRILLDAALSEEEESE